VARKDKVVKRNNNVFHNKDEQIGEPFNDKVEDWRKIIL